LAAAEADIVGLNGLTWTGSVAAPTGIGVDTVAERVRFVQAHARERAPELNVLVLFTAIGGDTEGAAARAVVGFGVAPDVVRTSPMMLVGSAPEVVDKLLALRERMGCLVRGRVRHRDRGDATGGRPTRRHLNQYAGSLLIDQVAE
jgi:hypothetical protein